MKSRALAIALFVALSPGFSHADPSPADPAVQATAKTQWSAWGGTVVVRWSHYMQDEGVSIGAPSQKRPLDSPRLTDGGVGVTQALDGDLFQVRRSGSIEFRTLDRQFNGFTGGSLQVQGGYVLTLPRDAGTISLVDFRLRPTAGDPMHLDVVGQDGKAWFYVDRLMYEIVDQGRILAIYTADMRMSRALAERLGRPEMADQSVGDLEILTELQVGDGPNTALVPYSDPNPSHWHGDPVPGQPAGTIYQADLFMQSFSIVRKRQDGTSGPEGTGRIVFAPSSTLKNNVNNGSAQVTVSGQGELGTSTALWTADIPWRAKFSGNQAPYNNDQHPYLVWNLYRINANGSIEQIARSGVKHAWLTTNQGCASGENHDGSILGRACSDTYTDGNNDANKDLSLRSEIIPATGQWGRCGSIFDPGCTGSNTNSNPTDDGFVRRLAVHEQQISPTKNPGATYLFDSWYLARQDINIYNSQASLWVTPSYSGSAWNLGGATGYKLGSVTDRWVSENVPTGTSVSNKELSVAEGHAKLAVRVTDLGNGQWRYDYAVHNLDFARAVTQGAEPNLRVVSNKGFDRFAVPLPAGAVVGATSFSDGDLDSANDWTVSTTGGQVAWTAAAGNTLDWGTLYSFSVTVNKPPVASSGELRVAETGSPSGYTLDTLAPTAGETPVPVASVTPSSLSLSVNAGSSASTTLTVGNSGGLGSSLTYTVAEAPTSCASPSDVTWLSATPASGAVSGGATAPVTVTGNAAALSGGTYTAKLCLTTNDPQHAAFEVPVTLTVTQVTTHTVGGTVSGLAGSGLVLKLNGSTSLPVSQNGSFTFPAGLATGATYAVTVGTQPSNPTQSCVVSNGAGTVGSVDVTNVLVTCAGQPPQLYTVGGRVSGLTGSGLVLKLNGGSDLAMSTNGLFNFPGGLPTGTHYEVTVGAQPSGQVCTVTDGSGTIGAANVSNVRVACAVPTYTVGGTVSGLSGGGLVLRLNGTADLPISANGAFTFPGGLADGASYVVTVATQPASPRQLCTVGGGSGSIAAANVTGVAVTCVADDVIFIDGFESAPVR